MSLQISKKPFVVFALTALLVSAQAQAGFVMGGSGSNSGSKTPRGYSSSPRIEEPTPEYEAIESETIQIDNSTTPMPEPVEPEAVQSEILSEPVVQEQKRYPSYPDTDAKPVRAFQPAPIAAPTRSSEMPKEEPHLQLKKMGNLPVTKPETQVEMMDSTPDNMPYRSGPDVMRKPVIETVPKTWNESDADVRPQDQGQTRRISSEIKADGVLSVPPSAAPSAPETRVYSNAPEIIRKVPAYNGTIPVTPEGTPASNMAPQGVTTLQAGSSAAAQPQRAAPASPTDFDEAVGFASDIPLALALSQVVPPNYAYSFDTGINPGYRVSWNGGKPWNVVVQEMVAPLNMHAQITGNMVVIRPGAKQGAASIPQTTPSGMPAPALKMADAKVSAPPAIAPAAQKAAAPVMNTEEKAEAVPAPAMNKMAEQEITEDDVLKPVMKQAQSDDEGPAPPPPALEIIEPSNKQLDLPEGQPRRAQVQDPGEQVSEQVTEQIKPIKSPREFPDIPTAEKIEMASVKQEVAAKVDQEQTDSQPRIWEAKQGDSLKKILSDWSNQANVELNWGAAHDYPLSSNVFINGTYSNAVKILFTHGFDKGEAPAHRLSDAGGKAILVVQDNPA